MTKISTGLSDSDGFELFVGDKVKLEVTCNQEFHGNWSIYEIKQQGLTPILSYVRSEKGQMLPKGACGCVMADMYDVKNFCFATDARRLRPMDRMEVWYDD